MFGGLAFMWHGHMLCGLMAAGGLYRVGKAGMDAALALPGTGPMRMGARSIGGYVCASPAAMGDDALRGALLAQSRAFCATLPPRPRMAFPAAPR